MFSTLFSQLFTDPDQILQEKLDEWTAIWQCTDETARAKACAVVRKAMADALLARTADDAYLETRLGGQHAKAAKCFRKGTAVGGDNWPLREYVKVLPGDLDDIGVSAATWRSQCIVPMQYLLNIMSMIPKKKRETIA